MRALAFDRWLREEDQRSVLVPTLYTELNLDGFTG